MELLKPSLAHLASYTASLSAGWSPDNVRGEAEAVEQLAAIKENAEAFIERLWDPDALGPRVTLPDGSSAERLPGFVLWMWDGEFCGSIGFRWQPETSDLPAHVLGHVGYSVVPWKRGNGYAKEALRRLLPLCREQQLTYIDLTMTPDNIASRRVVVANGGEFVRRFVKLPAYGGGEAPLYRIRL